MSTQPTANNSLSEVVTRIAIADRQLSLHRKTLTQEVDSRRKALAKTRDALLSRGQESGDLLADVAPSSLSPDLEDLINAPLADL